MHSLISNHTINSGTMNHNLIVTSIRMDNDIDGNPRYKTQVWTHNVEDGIVFGHLWSPKIKGYTFNQKGDYYILRSVYNLQESIEVFIQAFEWSVQQ